MLFGPTLPRAAVGRAKVLPADDALILSFGIANAAKTDEGADAHNLHLPLAFSVRVGARLGAAESITVIFQPQIMTGFPKTIGSRRIRIVPGFAADDS